MFKRTAPVPAGASQSSFWRPKDFILTAYRLFELLFYLSKTPSTAEISKAWLDKLATIKPPNVSVASPHGGRSSHPNKEDIGDSVICSIAQPTNANVLAGTTHDHSPVLEAIVPNTGFRPQA
nr:hypothetical protein L203_00093 [Cryptococcus depauperatus CBS 7841]